MAWTTFPMRVERSRHISPQTLEIAFQRIDGVAFDYKAGQFMNIHFEVDGAPVHRSYSIASAPDSDGPQEVAIAPVKGGLATELLFGLHAGDVIQASGPYGRFVLRDDAPCRHILAATGTGVTPYRAMLPELERRLAADPAFQVDILLGVWNRDELLYGDDFSAFAARHERARFHACYSRVLPEQPEAWEVKGYVQQQFAALGLNPDADIIYLCGNPNMIDDAVVILKEQGFPLRNVRREKYLPSKTAPRA